jgi:hypothetical protein
VLGAESLLEYELGLPDIVGGGINDLVNVTGALTLDGTPHHRRRRRIQPGRSTG